MKISRVVVGAAVMAAAVAGCSGSDDDKAGGDEGRSSAYCQDLKSVAADIKQLQGGDVSEFGAMVGKFPDLAQEAPESISDDWTIFSQAFTDVEKKFEASGLKLSDLAAYQSGDKELPKGVDIKKVQAAVKSYQTIATDKVVTASKNIDKHANDVCKVSLGTQ